MSEEKIIGIAAKLFERRRIARELWGDGYEDTVGLARRFIRDYMAKYGLKLMPAVLEILKKISNETPESIGAQLAISAAAVDLAEGIGVA